MILFECPRKFFFIFLINNVETLQPERIKQKYF